MGVAKADDGRRTTEDRGGVGSSAHTKAAGEVDPTRPRVRVRHEEKWAEVLARTFGRQRDAILGKVGPTAQIEALWDAARWDRELQADLQGLNTETALDWARFVAETMDSELDEDRMAAWLLEHSRVQAEYINDVTRAQIGDALTQEEPRSAVWRLFELAIAVRAWEIATSAVTSAASFGSQEAAKQGGLRTKMWQVNSRDPRDAHIAMDGQTVGIRELFSNGMKWPGDPAGGADNNANCMCSLRFGR